LTHQELLRWPVFTKDLRIYTTSGDVSGFCARCYLQIVPRPTLREIRTTDAPTPAFSYSQGVVFGDLLFIAGQVPRHPVTRDVPVSLSDQVRQTLENLAAVARAAGTSLEHALKVNVYLDDLSTIEEFDAIYSTFFSEPLPARTTVQAGLRGYLVEIDAIVAIEAGDRP
jgi:2-iminobutanoate/2-iminopropanoate deaminase